MLENCFGSIRPDVKLARKVCDTVLKISGSLVDLMLKNLMAYTKGLNDTVNKRTAELEVEQQKSEQLLQELLPKSVAHDLKLGIQVRAQKYESATILYSDIVGFTSLCSESQPMEVVTLLSGMYARFDIIINQQKGYKVSDKNLLISNQSSDGNHWGCLLRRGRSARTQPPRARQKHCNDCPSSERCMYLISNLPYHSTFPSVFTYSKSLTDPEST